MTKANIVLTVFAISGAFAHALGEGSIALAGAIAAAVGFGSLAVLKIKEFRQTRA